MGDIFGKYQLVDKIADGGMAEVFLARQDGEIGGFSKEVAIKRMFPHLAEEQEIIDMFLDEGRIAASLNHPNIVQVYDLGIVNEHLYLAMEFVDGKDLRSVLEKGFEVDNPLPLELAASIVAQVAAGLHYAHTRTDDDGEPMNIVHRDVSPQNVLISVDGAVKICDFGIAKAEHRIGHTKAGQLKGKWSYMAPEQIESGDASPQSDIFALGILLYETSTMTRLFQADNQYEALEKILYAQFDPPSQVRAGYPAELERIVMKALSRDPSSRYESAEAMQLEIENWLVQNQASTSPVHVARYMRNLFGDPLKERRKQLIQTAEIDLSDEDIRREDARAAAAAEPEPAADEPVAEAPSDDAPSADQGEARRRALEKKDVTEMDETDLDYALDNALGAPGDSSADPFALQRPSEASEAEAAETLATAAAAAGGGDAAETVVDREKPSFDDKTIITTPNVEEDKRPEPLAAADPAPPAVAPESEKAPVENTPVIDTPLPAEAVPPADEVPVPQSAAAEVPASPASPSPQPPPAARPAITRSGTVPTAPPPSSGPPPATRSQEQRAPVVDHSDDSRSHGADLSTDFLDPAAFKTGGRTGVIALVGLAIALIAIVAVVAVSWDTSDSTMVREAEKTNIDPALLEPKIAEPLARVQVPYEVTPADAAVVVNGRLIDDPNGSLPLVEGARNEVRFYAAGHRPAVQFVDGQPSGSPVTATLSPLEPGGEVADLEIITEPRDALVFVDGEQVGTSPTTVRGLTTAFEHHVEIRKEGRYGYSGLIGLLKDSTNPIEVQLHEEDSARKNYVEVIFSAIPRGTSVNVGGETYTTKSFKNYDRNEHLEVEFTEKDSRPSRHVIDLEGVGTLELRPVLRTMKRERGKISVVVEPEGPDLYIGANSYGQGPATNLDLPEGPVKVVLDSPAARGEAQVEVIPNSHTEYVVSIGAGGKVSVTRR